MGRKCINRSQASYCVSFTSAESCAKLQYTTLSLRSHTSRDVLDQLLLTLATSISVRFCMGEINAALADSPRCLTRLKAGLLRFSLVFV